MNILLKTLLLSSLLFPAGAVAMSAQEQPEPPDMTELAEKEADRLQRLLNLEDWQVFYVDSIMTHDYTAMRDEIQDLSKARVSNSDVYQRVQDKWMEQMYQSFSKVFNEEQWDKYLKAGAQRDKRLRDKREAKRQQ